MKYEILSSLLSSLNPPVYFDCHIFCNDHDDVRNNSLSVMDVNIIYTYTLFRTGFDFFKDKINPFCNNIYTNAKDLQSIIRHVATNVTNAPYRTTTRNVQLLGNYSKFIII